ncbi:tRNA (adenosine(37)-N6)-threonylcarbamoyltransferase complex ATPase subunit type 1 TsaE [Candidatus Berkelbacteria bacterium]|nr:tRNA (adenosine(37)-N6)-threonylcarbamoyltransferase complex ATPase subunit type 1 TsaE [Candidatus Berkelbacteria bacterium]
MALSRIRIPSLPALAAYAADLAAALRPGDVVTLSGPLGVGKTALVKALARSLGITDEVISPTFVYQQTYRLPTDSSIRALTHLDLYRLTSDADVTALGLVTEDPTGVVVIEWPERAPTLASRATLQLTWTFAPDGSRDLTSEWRRP